MGRLLGVGAVGEEGRPPEQQGPLGGEEREGWASELQQQKQGQGAQAGPTPAARPLPEAGPSVTTQQHESWRLGT